MSRFTVERFAPPENVRALRAGKYALHTVHAQHLGECYRITFYADGCIRVFLTAGAYPLMTQELLKLKLDAIAFASSI